jgi:hypothetical protein
VSAVATISGMLVAACFLAACATKLRHPALFADGLMNAGMPHRAIKPLTIMVPAAELAAAILLLVPASARDGAFLAAAILAVFTLYIGRVLAQHRELPCNCFIMRARAAPVSGWAVVRNTLLLSCALLAGLTHSYRGLAGARIHPVDALIVILTALCVFLMVVCVALLRRYGDTRTQLAHLQSLVEAAGLDDPKQDASVFSVDYPMIGTRLPQVVADATELTPGAPHLLLFISTECAACRDVLTALGDGAAARFADRGGRLIMSGHLNEAEAKVAHPGLGIVSDKDGSLTAALQLPGVPCVLAVTADKTIDQFVAGAPAILSMLESPAVAAGSSAITGDRIDTAHGISAGSHYDATAAFERLVS